MTTKEIPAEILAGMQLLDEKAPALLSEQLGYEVKDWRPLINKEALDMQWGCKCILGQLFGDYNTGLDNLGIEPDITDEVREYTTKLGFAISYDDKIENYSNLTQAWKEALS